MSDSCVYMCVFFSLSYLDSFVLFSVPYKNRRGIEAGDEENKKVKAVERVVSFVTII